MNNLLGLLSSVLQSETFMKVNSLQTQELKISLKEILIDELRDPEVRVAINGFLVHISQNQQVKTSFITLVKDVFSSKESEQTVVNLLTKGKSGIMQESATSK